MNNIICVVRDQQFKDKAKQLNLSEDALESIVHKFKNDLQDSEAFPSDSYIRAQFAVSNIVNPKDYDNLKAIWDAEFSQPITVDSLAEAITFRDEAAKYFKPEAIAVKPQSDGTFKIIIAAPQKPTANAPQVGEKKPIVYNEEQEAAIEAAVKHINAVRSGRSKQKFFTIQGKAGTGKTTIVNEILNRLKFQGYVTPTVIMGALAHKATTVLKEKISPEVKQKYRFENRTIAGMLGMRENDRTGEFEPVKGQRPPIQLASIVIVDEASMVNEEQLALILEATKNRSIPVIFLGDIGQLPPIRTTSFYKKKNINPNEISPIFTDSSIPKSMLSVRVRQGEDSPVLEYADNYWNYSQEKRETYPNDLHSKSKVTDKGALIIQRKEVDLVKQLLPLFREAKRIGNPNLVKIVTYTTNSNRGKESAVDRYNRLIREALYPGSKTDTFEEGDLIIFNDTYGDEDGAIPNSTEASVIKVRPCDSALPKIEGVELEEVERAYITIRTKDGQQVEVPAIVPTKENRAKHNRNINKLKKHRSDVYNKGGNYGEAKYAYEHYKNKYAANIGYAYAISSHKSQGSTYDVVAVDAVDINGVRAEEVSLKTKARSIYTGLTRASNVTIVSSNTTNEGTIYTDIKGINDRINSVKNGTATDETFVPETEEDYFSEVTEDDLDDLIHDPEAKKKALRKRGNMEDVKVNASDEKARIEKLKESDDDEVNLEKDDWDDDLDDDEDEGNSEEDEEEETSAQDRTYADFVAKQKQLNSIIKFNRKTHTYFINGKQADFSVTQFRDFIFGKGKRKENDFLRIASRLGNTHDSFLRDYFAGEIKDSYPNLNKEQVKKLRIQAAKLETKLREQLGEDVIFITDEDLLKVASTVTYDGKSYTVAGTLDMVAIDSKGNIYIVDFKTHRANLNEELSDDDKEGYAFQVTLYNAMVASNPLFKNKLRSNYIAQFNIKYADPRQNEYSFDDEQVFISINGEDVELQDAQKDSKVPYKAGVFSNLISLNADIEDMDIEVSPIKTSIQKREESKKVGEKTAVEPKRYSAQMVKFYGKKKRDGIKAVSTFGAILEGKRTATTRWNNLDFWKKVKVGDIITFKNSEGKEVNVRVTVAPHKLTKDTDPEEWSKKEGWSIEKFNEDVLPHIKKDDAYQLEYEVIKDKPSSIEINSKSGKYAVLSNFGDKEFTIDGKTFPTVEHYFQWAKAIHCKDYAMANRIKKATSAKQAKYLGSHELNMSKEQQKSWDKFSRNVMKKGMKEALEQNEDAKDLLLSTGTVLLTHYLGGPFADVLMELREEFGGAGKPENAKEIEKKIKEEAKKSKEVPQAPTKKNEGTKNSSWTRRGEKQIKISTEGYRKGDPKNNPDVAYVFTENAQAASSLYKGAQGYASKVEAQNPKLKLAVSDVKGTNQAGIRMDLNGKAYPNTYGIVVKKRQQDEDGNWLSKEGQFKDTDEDFEIFKEFNNFFFDRLSEAPQKKIIFPSQMALGKSALPKRFAEWLANELNTKYGIQSTILKNKTAGYEGYGLSIDSIEEKKIDETDETTFNNTKNNANDSERFAGVEESEKTINSDKTILSNEELAYWNKKGVDKKPRILVGSERTDPAFHVEEILDIINGNKTVNEWGIKDGKRVVVNTVSGHDFAGLYLITKHDGLPMLKLLQTKIPKLIHFSITSLGGTKWEPGVMKYNDLLDRIEDYLKQGLDPESVTIRIDPIVPGVTTKEDIENIVKRASSMGIKRIRFSIMDAYFNTRKAMSDLGYDFSTYYGDNFFANEDYINDICDFMLSLKDKYGITLGTCAEKISRKGISKEGCLSVAAINNMLGTSIEDRGTDNNNQRKLCSCYGGKIDALQYNAKCASHCIYCYAKHENDTALKYYNEDGTLKNNKYTQSRPSSSNLHVEKISDRYTPKTSSDVEQFNTAAEALRKQGWHVEFYSKKSRTSTPKAKAGDTPFTAALRALGRFDVVDLRVLTSDELKEKDKSLDGWSPLTKQSKIKRFLYNATKTSYAIDANLPEDASDNLKSQLAVIKEHNDEADSANLRGATASRFNLSQEEVNSLAKTLYNQKVRVANFIRDVIKEYYGVDAPTLKNKLHAQETQEEIAAEEASAEPSYVNDVMTISIDGNPKKGFFELVKDAEENSYSVHFKTKSKKAMNESDFAEEALEDSEKEDLFKALIFAIPEGGIVSTWGTLTKGGISALDSLAKRSNGSLSKIGDKTAKNTEGSDIMIPVYAKLTEDEIIANNLAKIRKTTAVQKKHELPKFSGEFYGIKQYTGDTGIYTGIFNITLQGSTGIDSIDITDGSKNDELASLIKALPYSSIVSLNRSNVNANFLYTLDEMLRNPTLYAVWGSDSISIDPNSVEGMIAKEYARTNKKFPYNSKTGELKLPKFTVGKSYDKIQRIASYNKLINNDVLTQEELRKLSKATMYKLSEFITMIQSYKNGYQKLFGENTDKDFTQMSRIQIINEISIKNLLLKVRERVFDSRIAPDTTSEATLDKMDVIFENWDAFVELGYDTLIGLEEIALDGGDRIKNDLNDNTDEEDESIVQELFGSSIEHWQVGFRQVSAFNSLSKMIKRTMDSLYVLDENGNQKFNEFGIADHLDAQEAVSKILNFTQGAQSLDAKDASGNLLHNSMISKLKENLNAEPWLQQVIDLLEDKYDEKDNLIKKADEQFKAQFYSNFKKYFQKYAITYKKRTKTREGFKDEILVKVINESPYSEVLLNESRARENSFAIGGFKLKNKDGSINLEALKKLKELSAKLSDFREKVDGTKGKVSELIDLNEYHNTIKDVIDLLGMASPESETLNNLFAVKTNLREFSKRLEYLVDKIENIKKSESITGFREYKQMLDVLAKQMGLEMESVSYESGKMYYSYVLPSYLGRLVTKLKSENMSPEEYREFLQKEYLSYKWFAKDIKGRTKIRCRWLDRLSRSDDARKNFTHVTSLHYLGTDYTAKTPVEYIASMMKMFFFDNNKKWAYFRVPMLSNKPSEEYIKFERITRNYQDLITGYMWDVFTQELDRIQAVRQRQKTIDDDQKIVSKGKKETFDKRGLEFVFEDYLQKYLDGSYINDFDTSTVQYGSEEEVEQLLKEKEQADRFHELLNKKLDGTISEESTENAELMELFKVFTKKGFEENYQAAKQQWIDEGFIQVDAEGKITKVFNNMKLSEDDLKEFFWNDAFAATQILELTITDMAFAVDTEDLQKRLAQLHAPGTQANILAKDSKGNLYTKDGIERTIYIKDDMVKSSMLANLKMAKEQIILDTPKERRVHVEAQLNGVISSFEKINFADAQGYSCPSSYRKKMGIFGNWDARMEDAYEKVIHPEQYPDVNLSDMLDVLWQPLKPFVYTQLRKPGYNDILPEIKVPVQNKNSEYVLVMADAVLRYAGMPNKLQAIYDFMEESQHNADGTLNGQGIDTIQFMSAVNMGCSGVIDLNDTVDKNGEVTHYKTEEEIKEELGKAYEWDEEGNRVYSQDYVHEIPFEDYIIQQNVPSHFMKHEQAHGSQDRILTFADMLDVDPYTGETNYLVIDNKKVSVAKAKKNYFQAIADNINDSVQELVRRFNLENEDSRARNEAISKVLQDTILKDSRYGSDLLWACSTNEYGEFNIPLSDPIQSNRIQQLLNSIIKNTINKQEIAGGPLVQVSSWGLSTSLNIRFKDSDNNLLLTEKEFNNLKDPFPNESITPRGYREQTKDSFWKWKSVDGYDTYEEYIEDQAGVAYFESLVPIPDENFAKDFMKKDANGNEYIDVAEIEKVNSDMLNMIGYRIPTENKYSMIPIKVVGFLPRTGGEGIMLPADITNLAGSDFDIDKDYIMKMVFNRIERGGKVIYEKPTEGRAARNNLIIATQLAVLQSEQVQKQLFTPGNFEEPKKFGYRISYIQNEARRTGVSPEELWQTTDNWDNDKLKDSNKATKNLIFNNVQVQFHKQNMTAGKLIGIFAQANVSHAFISLNDEASLMIPSEYSFSLNGIKVEGNFAIDSVLTKDKSTNISNNLASLLAASVDAVKDPILNLMNININTANMVTAMIRMGFSLQTVSLLASQPIIVDLIRDYAIQKANSYVDIGELISSYKENMPEDVKQIEDIKVTDQDLIANLTGEEPTTNYMVLEIFDRMRTIADTFGDITHMTRYNSVTSAVGPFASDSMTQRTKDKAFNDNAMIGTAVKEACNNPILSAFRDGSNYIERQLLGRNLIQAESKFELLLEKLGKKLGFSRGVPAKYANAFSDFYMSFYVNAGQESVFDLSYDNRKYVLTQFPKEFLRLKSKYKDNLLINSIQYVESDREEFGFLQLKTRGLNSTVMEDLKQAWVSLYEDENTRDLAINLVQYNFFRGSFGFSPKTFMSLTPNTVKSNLNGYIEVLNSKDSRVKTMDMDNRIINQFILHNQKLIIDRFTGLEDYNPVEIYDDVYGEVIQLDRKPKEPEEDKGKKKKKTPKTLKASRPIIKIDNDFYFVIPKEDSSILVVKKVDALGGDGQGFEISVDEDFPKSIYSSDFKSTRKDSSEDEGGLFKKDNISEEAAEVLLDQLFEDDDTLGDVVEMPASKAIDEINKELSSRSIHKKVLNKGKNVKTIMKLLDKLEGISNPRELLNKSERTLSDEGFCN